MKSEPIFFVTSLKRESSPEMKWQGHIGRLKLDSLCGKLVVLVLLQIFFTLDNLVVALIKMTVFMCA